MTLHDNIKQLPVEEKAAILSELQDDVELNDYLHVYTLPQTAKDELERRDKAYREGKEPTTTWDSVKDRLQELQEDEELIANLSMKRNEQWIKQQLSLRESEIMNGEVPFTTRDHLNKQLASKYEF